MSTPRSPRPRRHHRPPPESNLRLETISRRKASPQGARRVVAVGNFDGIHRGHQALIAACVRQGHGKSARATVLTFDPHPAAVVSKSGAPPRILTNLTRRRILADLGIDEIATLAFDAEMSQRTPREFVDRVLVQALQAIVVVVGEGFRFGASRAVDVENLRELGAQHFETIAVPTLSDGKGERVSSSRVRAVLQAGHLEKAAELLGRPYEIDGIVIHGDHRGRTLGYPTANIEIDGIEALPHGIYAADAWVEGDDRRHRAAVSLGTRPTFDGVDRRLEAHLLGFHGDLYGRVIRLRFLKRLRGEERFESVDALRRRMALDVSEAAAFNGDAQSG